MAIVVPFNGVSLALIGFPHFEIAIPALLMAFFAAHFSGHTRTAYAVLLLGLSIREDTGLHYFGSFLVLAASLRWSRQNEKAKSDSTLFLRFAIICLLYSLAAIAIQKTLFPTDDDALRRVYLGNPIYSHINYEFLRERAQFFFSNRLYIIIPLILLFVIALVKRNALLAVGGVSVLPWIFFSVLGISPWAGTLASYYGFPIVTGVLWPVICSQLELCYRQSGLIATSNGNDRLVFTAVVVALSIVFFPGSKGNHDATPWKDFIPRWIGKIDGTRNALELFFNDNSEIARFVVDDAVASLRNNRTAPREWRYFMNFNKEDLQPVDAIVFLDESWLSRDRLPEVLRTAKFRYTCRINNSDFLVATRRPHLNRCQPYQRGPSVIWPTTETIFDRLTGWSHDEGSGRWTIGDRAFLPPIDLRHGNMLCFVGHAYLPNDESKVIVKLYGADAISPMGQVVFSRRDQNNESCMKLRDSKQLIDESRLELRIVGFSSPKDNHQSGDERPLGIFVRSIEVRN